jgi:iron complex outermembrane receptor protein
MSKKHLPAGKRGNLTVLASTISAIIGAGGLQAAQAQAQDTADVEEIVLVTGSRIVRRDLTASSPIMTIDAERFDLSSTISVETVLNQMPQFIPAQTQFSAIGQIQTSPTTSLGIGTVNLRGVSTNRTLVLVDGRRAQPSNASLVVDINTIPSAAIERVETITGGASAVYGADALAGVVNFVLKDNYEGISVDLQSGWTEAGDGEETRVSALLGLNSNSGDSNVLLGVEWYDRNASFQKNHDFYVEGWNDPNNRISTFFPSMPAYNAQVLGPPPDQDVIDQMFLDAHGIAPGTINPSQAIYFNLDGTPFVRQNGEALGFDWSQLGRPDIGDGFYGLVRRGNQVEQVFYDAPLATPLERRSAFGKAQVDINDNLRAFVQANFSRIEVETYSAGPPPAAGGWGGTIPNDPTAERPAIPENLRILLDSRDDPGTPENEATNPWYLSRGLDFLGHFGPINTSDVYQIMAGVEGQLDSLDLTWEAYYSSGETNATSSYGGLPSIERWTTLVATPNFGENATVAGPGGYSLNCTSGLPIYYGTRAGLSQDCVNSLLGSYKQVTVIKQEIAEANVQGKIADMEAGELRFAAGVSSRKNEYRYDPLNPESSIFDRPLGLFPSNPASGRTKVDEIYGELLVPVVERLNLELGYRHSNYDNAAGTVGTYKALFDIQATDWARIRGGYQLASRAPNSAELFQSATTIFEFGFSGDPCQVNTTAEGWGNKDDNDNRLQTQQLCADLINTDADLFPTPGSAEADSWILGGPGTPAFTGINSIRAGSSNLESEEAETFTLGAVFQGPGSLDGLTASIDYYKIEVTEAIATFSGDTIYRQCFNANGVSNPTYSADNLYCGFIERSDANGGPGVVNEIYLNTGFIETAGIDLAVNWATDLSTGGTFYINSQLTYIDYFNTQEIPGDPVDHWQGTIGQGGQFEYRFNATVGYNFAGGKANVGVRMRHLPEIKSANARNDMPTGFFPLDAWTNFDLFAGYTINDKYQLRGGIDNLLDEDPSIWNATATDSNTGSTIAGYYDTLGRRMYVGIKMVF